MRNIRNIITLALILIIMTACGSVNGDSIESNNDKCKITLIKEEVEEASNKEKEVKVYKFSGEFMSNDELNVKRYPDSNTETIGIISPHEKIIATGKSDHEGILWYKIQYGDKEGWVLSENLVSYKGKSSEHNIENSKDNRQSKVKSNEFKQNSEVEKHIGTYYAITNLNVHSGAGQEYKILGSLPRNETIITTGKLNGWYEFDYNGNKGYVNGDNLSQMKIKVGESEVTIQSRERDDLNDNAKEINENLTIPRNHNINSIEREVIDLINKERQKKGLQTLSIDNNLNYLARLKALDIGKHGYRSHTSPKYGTPFEMMKNHGVNFKSAAENISGYYLSPSHAVEGWMNSPSHKDNILDERWTHIGAGYSKEGEVWTTLFIQK